MRARWQEETQAAAEFAGWHVVETWSDAYQEWGAHLLVRSVPINKDSRGDVQRWAVLPWVYDDRTVGTVYGGTPEQHHKVFGKLIEECPDEAAARMKFAERKGW